VFQVSISGGLELYLGGLAPKAPRGDGTVLKHQKLQHWRLYCRHAHFSVGCVYWFVPIVMLESRERTCSCSCL